MSSLRIWTLCTLALVTLDACSNNEQQNSFNTQNDTSELFSEEYKAIQRDFDKFENDKIKYFKSKKKDAYQKKISTEEQLQTDENNCNKTKDIVNMFCEKAQKRKIYHQKLKIRMDALSKKIKNIYENNASKKKNLYKKMNAIYKNNPDLKTCNQLISIYDSLATDLKYMLERDANHSYACKRLNTLD